MLPLGYFARGIAYRESGNLQGAERDFDNAVRLNPTSTSYRWARFEILRRRYENLASLPATNFERPIWGTLKSALLALMMENLRQILHLDPHDVSVRLELASLLNPQRVTRGCDNRTRQICSGVAF